MRNTDVKSRSIFFGRLLLRRFSWSLQTANDKRTHITIIPPLACILAISCCAAALMAGGSLWMLWLIARLRRWRGKVWKTRRLPAEETNKTERYQQEHTTTFRTCLFQVINFGNSRLGKFSQVQKTLFIHRKFDHSQFIRSYSVCVSVPLPSQSKPRSFL
jgi:hypothetical protein